MQAVSRLFIAAAVLVVAGCAGGKPSVEGPKPPVSAIPTGFSETPMMRSSKSVEPATFNLDLGAAARRGEDWVRDPAEVALRISKAGEAPRVRLYREDNRSEAPDSSTVTVIMDRLLDDSIAGIWTQYRLARTSDGSWRVASVLRAFKSYRGPDADLYRAEPTP
jgi:hypothetical protein